VEAVYIVFKAMIRQMRRMQLFGSKSAMFLLVRAVQSGWSSFHSWTS